MMAAQTIRAMPKGKRLLRSIAFRVALIGAILSAQSTPVLAIAIGYEDRIHRDQPQVEQMCREVYDYQQLEVIFDDTRRAIAEHNYHVWTQDEAYTKCVVCLTHTKNSFSWGSWGGDWREFREGRCFDEAGNWIQNSQSRVFQDPKQANMPRPNSVAAPAAPAARVQNERAQNLPSTSPALKQAGGNPFAPGSKTLASAQTKLPPAAQAILAKQRAAKNCSRMDSLVKASTTESTGQHSWCEAGESHVNFQFTNNSLVRAACNMSLNPGNGRREGGMFGIAPGKTVGGLRDGLWSCVKGQWELKYACWPSAASQDDMLCSVPVP